MAKAHTRFTLKDLCSRGFVEVDGHFFPPGSHQAVSRIVEQPVVTGKKKPKSVKKPAESGNKIDLFVIFVKQELDIDLVTEFKFHPDRGFRFDYADPLHKIAIEQEGGIWRKGGGAHSRPANIIRDITKYNLATANGWKVIRRTPSDLCKIETIELIKQSIA